MEAAESQELAYNAVRKYVKNHAIKICLSKYILLQDFRYDLIITPEFCLLQPPTSAPTAGQIKVGHSRGLQKVPETSPRDCHCWKANKIWIQGQWGKKKLFPSRCQSKEYYEPLIRSPFGYSHLSYYEKAKRQSSQPYSLFSAGAEFSTSTWNSRYNCSLFFLLTPQK